MRWLTGGFHAPSPVEGPADAPQPARMPSAASCRRQLSVSAPVPAAEFDRFYGLMVVAGRLQANPAIEPPFTKT
jgi:hypothetical protein